MFEFVADHPVLDFVATVAERHTTRHENLTSPADLATWVAESGLVDDELRLDEAGFQHALAVREALFGLVSALIDDCRPAASDLELVNGAASRPRPQLRLDREGRVHRRGDLDAVLAELATDGLDLAGSPDREALHWCADAACTRPFVDRSRGQRRRWCGMKGCGDRAKAAAYRHRLRTPASS